MNSKDMDMKALLPYVEKKILEGHSQRDIYNEIGTDDAASVIAATPTLEVRKKYLWLNRLLTTLIIYYAAIKIVVLIFIIHKLGNGIIPIIYRGISPVITLYVAKQISKFRGSLYQLVGLLGITLLLKGRSEFAGLNIIHSTDSIFITGIYFVPIFIGTVLAFYLKKKLVPHLKLLGAKTDSSGAYLFLKQV